MKWTRKRSGEKSRSALLVLAALAVGAGALAGGALGTAVQSTTSA